MTMQRPLCGWLQSLADTIGVRMCVEGVEDDGQLQILKDMKKVQYIQGYYYDKPLTEEAFEKKYL